jgi:DNA-binding transcriptional MerR regulator
MTDLLLPHTPVEVPAAGIGIGEAAQACGLTPDTLRYYEKENLLLAAAARDTAGRRRYTGRDLAWIAGLVMLRETGMPIAQMRRMAELYRTPRTDSERLRLLEEHRDRVIAEQRRIAQHLEAIETKITSYRSALHTAG